MEEMKRNKMMPTTIRIGIIMMMGEGEGFYEELREIMRTMIITGPSPGTTIRMTFRRLCWGLLRLLL